MIVDAGRSSDGHLTGGVEGAVVAGRQRREYEKPAHRTPPRSLRYGARGPGDGSTAAGNSLIRRSPAYITTLTPFLPSTSITVTSRPPSTFVIPNTILHYRTGANTNNFVASLTYRFGVLPTDIARMGSVATGTAIRS